MMRFLVFTFRLDSSARSDSALVLIVGVSVLFLCALLLIASEETQLMLFLVGFDYVLAVVYIALVIYLFLRMLWRQDGWLLFFLCASACFVGFLFWFWSYAVHIVDHRVTSRLLMYGGMPYSFFSIAIGIAMRSSASTLKKT